MNKEIEAIINTTLQTQILQALKSAPEAIEAMVMAAISEPVSRDGTIRGYGDKVPFLEYIVGETLRNALRRAVVEEMNGRYEEIKLVVAQRLSSVEIADAVTKAIVGTAANEWNISVKFHANSEER